MRIEILRDAGGEIIATSQLALSGEVPVTAEVEEGQDLAEMDVPAKYMAMPAMDLIKRLQIDVKERAEEV
jgi:hypothetical protein